MNKAVMIGIVLAMAGNAYADQCAWIDAKAAAKAEKLLAKHPKVIEFCEPCGDQAPGAPQTANTVEVTVPSSGYKEIQINGRGVDLAYTYVQTSPRTYRNLAKLAGCEATGVSPSLDVDDETPNGVLITADPAPMPEPIAPEPAQVAPPPIVLTLPTTTPPPSPPQIVVLETRATYPWAMIALAGLTGFGATLFGVLALAALRRHRRALRPRASELRADK